jgi:hypothetical protein
MQRFEVQVKENDPWPTILEEKTIGPYFNRHLSPVSARRVRLNISEARDVPTISDFQLFEGTADRR